MITLKQVYKKQKYLFDKATSLVSKKGSDYNRKQQNEGDTLFNLRVCRLLGIVEHDTQGVMVRLSDKFMRLASLTTNPKENPQVVDEKIEDTIIDIWNYTSYLLLLYEEERNK